MTKFKTKKFLCVILIAFLLFMFGFAIVPATLNSVYATDGESSVETGFDYDLWLNSDNAWYDDAIDYETYKDYISKYNSNEEAIVVVVDSGICTPHPMFKDRIATAKQTKTYRATYQDESGGEVELYNVEATEGKLLGCAVNGKKSTIDYTGYVEGYEWYEFEDDDDKCHGTSVSGVIASLTPSNVKILPIKKANYNEDMEARDVYPIFRFIEELLKDGYNIVAINMSYSFLADDTFLAKSDADPIEPGIQRYDDFFSEKIKFLKEEYNVLTCASAGNSEFNLDGKNSKNMTSILARCADALVVAAIEKNNDEEYTGASFSCFGSTVDFAAPGLALRLINITTDSKVVPEKLDFNKMKDASDNTHVKFKGGTSYSAPIVAAMVANIAIDKNYYDENGVACYTASMIEERIINSTIDLKENSKNTSGEDLTGKDIYYGYGMVTFTNHMIPINNTSSDSEATYDGQAHNIDIKSNIETDVFYSLSENGEYDITDISNVDAFRNYTNGPLKIYYKLVAKGDTENKYFADTKGSAFLTINKREVGMTISGQEFEYGDVNLNSGLYSVVTGSIVAGDEHLFVLSSTATNTSSIGGYPISLNCTSENYNLSIENSADVEIIPRAISVNVCDLSIVYGTELDYSVLAYSITEGSIVNQDSLNERYITNYTVTSPVAGYDIEMSYENDNYNVDITVGTLTVTKREISVKVNDASVVYGSEIDLSTIFYEVTEGVIVNGDNLYETFSTKAVYTSPVSDYDIEMSYANDNYDVDIDEGTLTITPKTLEVTLQEQSSMYGEGIKLNQTAYEIDKSQLVGSDVIDITLTTTATEKDSVGMYSITAKTTNKNYVLKYDSEKYEITKMKLFANIANQEFEYGDVKFNNNSYTITQGKIAEGESSFFVLSTLATNTSSIGEYPIELDCTSDNYDLTVIGLGNVVINPRTMSVKVADASIVYGEELDLSTLSYTITEGSVVNEDKLNEFYSTAATKTSEVDTYDIEMGIENDNYSIDVSVGTLTITPRDVSVKVNNAYIEYGNVLDLSTLSYEVIKGELVNGDNLNGVYSTLATNLSPVNSYDIQMQNGNPNYKVNITKGLLFVTPRQISVSLNKQEFVYGENISLNDQAYSIIRGSLVGEDNLNIKLSTQATNKSNVGRYDIMIAENNANYQISYREGDLVVNKRVITIKINKRVIKRGQTFDSQKSTYNIVTGSVANEDDLKLIYSSDVNFNKLGVYKLTAVSNNENYRVKVQETEVKVVLNTVDTTLLILAILIPVLSALIVTSIVVVNKKSVKGRKKQD